MKLVLKRLKRWYDGEIVAPMESIRGGGFIYYGQTTRRHWTANAVRGGVEFYRRHWKWIWSTLIAVLALIAAVEFK